LVTLSEEKLIASTRVLVFPPISTVPLSRIGCGRTLSCANDQDDGDEYSTGVPPPRVTGEQSLEFCRDDTPEPTGVTNVDRGTVQR
jgi:hypothetical protein